MFIYVEMMILKKMPSFVHSQSGVAVDLFLGQTA